MHCIENFDLNFKSLHTRLSHFITQAIQKRKCTDIAGTPTMFSDILNHPLRAERDISSLKYAVVGGSPVTPSLVRQAESQLGF